MLNVYMNVPELTLKTGKLAWGWVSSMRHHHWKPLLHTSYNTTVLDSPPCRGADPLVRYHDELHASQTASQCTVGMDEGGGWGRGVRVSEQGRLLAGAQRGEKIPSATVPQGNEESRGGRHREGEKKSEEREREGECYFPGRLPQKSPFPLNSNTHTHKDHTHKHRWVPCFQITQLWQSWMYFTKTDSNV